MTTTLAADYRAFRADGVRAAAALEWARTRSNGVTFQWAHDDTGETTRDGFELRATVRADEWPELSYLGEFTNSPGPDTIAVPDGMRYAPAAFRVDYRYFAPAIPWREQRAGLSRMGFPRHVADCLAREYNRRDMRAYVETETYAVTVTASRAGVELGSASMGGIGFLPDTDATDRETYIDEIATDLIGEVIDEARANLRALCVS